MKMDRTISSNWIDQLNFLALSGDYTAIKTLGPFQFLKEYEPMGLFFTDKMRNCGGIDPSEIPTRGKPKIS